jgi:hypothetical protein
MELAQPHLHDEKVSPFTRVLAAAGILIGGVGAFAVAYFDPVNAGFFPVCPFYQATGFACPGCGLTRGFHALFHGDVLGALDYNALIPVYFFVFAYLGISMFLISVRGRGLSFAAFKPRLVYSFVVVFCVFAVVRNLPVYPFSVLFP